MSSRLVAHAPLLGLGTDHSGRAAVFFLPLHFSSLRTLPCLCLIGLFIRTSLSAKQSLTLKSLFELDDLCKGFIKNAIFCGTGGQDMLVWRHSLAMTAGPGG